jgi:hypothetical protein
MDGNNIHSLNTLKSVSKSIFLALSLSQNCKENNIIQSLEVKNSSRYDEASSKIIKTYSVLITKPVPHVSLSINCLYQKDLYGHLWNTCARKGSGRQL